jgi:hypothetical protein
VVVSVDEGFLLALETRHESLTALAWGRPGDAGLMAGPHRILDVDQGHLPFLFSPTEQKAKAVTHAAVCGLLRHHGEIPGTLATWLEKHRVEGFLKLGHTAEAASFYVVTACQRLAKALPYSGLTLTKGDRPLSPDKRQGYAVVYLPAGLQDWFDEACRQWDALSGELPE